VKKEYPVNRQIEKNHLKKKGSSREIL